MNVDFEHMPRDALIRELQKQREADVRMNAVGDSDPAVLLRELHLHQIELEVQNRELLETQLALEDSRARYADLYNAAPVGIVTMDARGVFTEMNLTAATLLGSAREALLGTGFSRLVVPGDRRRFWTHLRRCVSEECRVSTELRLLVRGRELHVQLVGATAAEQGGLSCRTSLVDISELKQSEARLRLLSDAGRSLACSLDYRSTLGTVVRLAVPLFADVCMLDTVGEGGAVDRVEVVADDEATQWKLEALLRRPVARAAQHVLQRGVIASGRSALFEQRPEARGSLEAETALLWDTLRATTMLVVPVSARGHTLGALTFVTASSQRRFQQSDVAFAEELSRRAAIAIDNALLYAQAQRAVQARENLLALVSHDLQNPLSVILMRASTLRDDRSSDAHAHDIDAIERAAKGMSVQIDDLLDLASVDAGRFSMRAQTVELTSLMEEVTAQQQPLAGRRGLALTCSAPDGSLEVRCDRGRIAQVLTNLLSNALKFTPHGGSITVSAVRQNDEACVAVVNTGEGIAPSQLPHIFDRYWQANPGERVGTGLGLSICKAIIDAHQARIWAESVPGEGAAIYFTLPLAGPGALPSEPW